MKYLLLIGSQAVGKMTVGQELAKITDFRLFHNHFTIEPVIELFGKFDSEIITELREFYFKKFAKSDCYGMIFTYVWAFDSQHDWDYTEHVRSIFEEVGAEIYCVELVADQATRLERNRTPNRLKHKVSKRDVETSEWRIVDGEQHYRCVSEPGEVPYENYLRIDNTNLSAEEAARQIKEYFGF